MKKQTIFILLLYLLFTFSGSLYGITEKTISLGGASSWDSALLRSGISEVSKIRPFPALVLTGGESRLSTPERSGSEGRSARGNFSEKSAAASIVDLALSFDEGKPEFFRDSAGHYRVNAAPALEAAGRQLARAGAAAALFTGISSKTYTAPLLIEINSSDALFAPGSRFRDFSLEFWLYPFQLESGEQVFAWTSSLPQAGTAQVFSQYIKCIAERNRLKWTFVNFFASPDRGAYPNIELSGVTPVVPKTWSHHIVRFDSNTGLVEYVMDGAVQDIKYATVSGREAGEVYTPIAGQGGAFSLGSSFTGVMDEFRIYSAFVDRVSLQKFPCSGRMETRAIDLGEGNTGIFKVDALGGRTSLQAAKGSIEFRENGRFRFSDDSEMQFFIRTTENPYWWDDSPWLIFTPGAPLPEKVRGRYVQLAVDFYPSSDGECSPYLEELRIRYIPNEAPVPPSSVTAAASNGGVQLRWKSSPDMETEGYLVYYGTKKDEYFGEDAILGVSPVDVGKNNSLYLDGLKNGVLYYFRIAAYKSRDSRNPSALHIGEFSREVTARPLEGL